MADMPPRRGRQRLGIAARKIAAAAEARNADEADVVGVGVRAVAKQIMAEVEPGALYWRAPMQYIAEQAAPRVAKHFNVPDAKLDELRAYLLSGMNEYLIALMGDFDAAHFETWVAAMVAAEQERT
jgi:hypothetical protein